jgi:hypothetical protein
MGDLSLWSRSEGVYVAMDQSARDIFDVLAKG